MAKTELMVLFKKIQRDDKKDVLKFEYKNKDKNELIKLPQSIYDLAGEMVNIEIEGSKCGPVSAELAKVNKDGKKVVLDLSLRGDSAEKAAALFLKAGTDVKLLIEPSQSSLLEEDKPKNDHEGIEYAVDVTSGTVLSFQERKKVEQEGAATSEEAPEEEWDEGEAEAVDPDQLEDDELPF